MNCRMTSFMVDFQLVRYCRWWLPLFLIGMMGATALAQSGTDLFPPRPEPAVYVHDYAGMLSANERDALEMRLRRYYDSTSTQIVVMIRKDIGDYDKGTYAIELGRKWGIGGRAKNNGILMLIKSEPPDRGIFIATGYGTEGAVPDILAGRIIRYSMAPLFKEGRYSAGINKGISDITAALAGEFKADPQDNAASDDGIMIGLIALFIIFVFMMMMIRAAKRQGGKWYTDSGPHRCYRQDPTYGGGGWWIGGGGMGGGGSWGSGGGGSSGGSFGGGDFGGGGAGGDW
jgi:uncharacterized protein